MQGLKNSPLESQLLHGDGIRLEEVSGLAEAPVLVTGLGISFVPVPCPHVPYLACTMHHNDCHTCSIRSAGGQMTTASLLQAVQHREDMSQIGTHTQGPLGYMYRQSPSSVKLVLPKSQCHAVMQPSACHACAIP